MFVCFLYTLSHLERRKREESGRENVYSKGTRRAVHFCGVVRRRSPHFRRNVKKVELFFFVEQIPLSHGLLLSVCNGPRLFIHDCRSEQQKAETKLEI